MDKNLISKAQASSKKNSESGQNICIFNFFFQVRALKIRCLAFSLNCKEISFNNIFRHTKIGKKCQLTSAVCLLFTEKIGDSIFSQYAN